MMAMNKKTDQYQTGFIALMVVMSVSALLLTLTGALTVTGWYTRQVVLETEAKVASRVAADGCIQQAIVQLIANTAYTGNATTTSGDARCYVYPIDRTETEQLDLQVRSTVGVAVTNLQVELELHDVWLRSIPNTNHVTSQVDDVIEIIDVTEVVSFSEI
jgi:hypothetical protein